MFKKLAFLTLITFHLSASAALVLNLDGTDYTLVTAVLDTDDNELRVDAGIQLLCSGGSAPTADNVTLTFTQIPQLSFALDTITIDRVVDDTEINALSLNQDVSCQPDPGEDIFFLDGFEEPLDTFR